MFWTSIKILHVSTECIPFAYVFKNLTGTFRGTFWHFIGVEGSQVATTSREEGTWKEGTCCCCCPCTCCGCWCLSEDAFIHSWVHWVWKAVQGLPTLQCILNFGKHICWFSQFLQSSEPVELTEAETEYAVNVVKHIYDSYVVLQYNCTNTIEEQLLEDVSSYISSIFVKL